MKYYLVCAALVLVSILVVLMLPILTAKTENTLISIKMDVPQIGSAVAGTYKYNLPPVSRDIPIASFSAKAILVKDLGTDSILFEKNAYVSLPIASTTKIMTALVGSEFYAQNAPLVASASAHVPGSRIGLLPGEVMTFRSLLYGMLLNSGNDAAFDIAENYPGKVPGFVAAMNNKAATLQLKNTNFENPAGFDSPNHYSSASDLAIMTEAAIKDPNLSRIFATKDTEIFSLDKKNKHPLSNLNKLLSTVTGVLGVKTGYTENAKENLVTLVDRGGHQILTVVLGSDDRFGESTKLIEWAYNNFLWQ